MEGRDVYKKKPFCVAVGTGLCRPERGREIHEHHLQFARSASSTAAPLPKLDLEGIRSFFWLCLTCFPPFSTLNCDS